MSPPHVYLQQWDISRNTPAGIWHLASWLPVRGIPTPAVKLPAQRTVVTRKHRWRTSFRNGLRTINLSNRHICLIISKLFPSKCPVDYPLSVVVYCFTAAPLLTKQTFLTDSRPSGRPAWIVMTLLVHPDWSYLPQISSRPIWHVLFFRSIVVTGSGNFDHVKFFPSEGLISQSFSQAFHTSTFASKG